MIGGPGLTETRCDMYSCCCAVTKCTFSTNGVGTFVSDTTDASCEVYIVVTS